MVLITSCGRPRYNPLVYQTKLLSRDIMELVSRDIVAFDLASVFGPVPLTQTKFLASHQKKK